MPDSLNEAVKTETLVPEEKKAFDYKTSQVDDTPRTRETLEQAIAAALHHKDGFIEAEPDVLDNLIRSPEWRMQGYLFYKGVKVYGVGMKEEADRRDSVQTGQLLHKDSGFIEGRT